MATSAAVAPARRNGAIGLTLMLSAMVLLNYVDRGALGIAAPKLKEELALSATEFGLAVSAFSWIYAPAQFAVGWLLSRVCVFRLVAVGLLVWAAATTLTGFVSSLAMLVMLRVALGVGEGVAFPAASAIIAAHVPDGRRGLANAVVSASLALGPALGIFAGGMILATYGWRPIFFVFGLATFVWLLPWLVISRPHWQGDDAAGGRVRMNRVLAEPTVWRLGFAHFFNVYPFYFLLAWLPLFLVKSRGFTIVAMTELLTLVYLTQAASGLLLGWWSDRLVAAGRNEGRVRQALMSVGLALIAVAILGAAFSVSPRALTWWLLLAAVGTGPGGAQGYAIAQIYAGRRAAGPVVGVMNGIGNTAGIVGPILTGVLVDHYHQNYVPAFAVAAAMPALGALMWYFGFARIEPLPRLQGAA